MLRVLFNEPKRELSGELKEITQAIDAFTAQIDESACYELDPSQQGRCLTRQGRLLLRARGFLTALDELEQSKYCSEQYSRFVHHLYEDEMEEQERDHYYRHVYFYKNSFIRVFSILDKLGYFLNEWYMLKTEQMKVHFSYFTVLRRLQSRRKNPRLEKELFEIKERYQEPLLRLRHLRNMEIHWINSELKDDWSELSNHFHRLKIEDLRTKVEDLEQGYQMVCQSMLTVFQHIAKDITREG